MKIIEKTKEKRWYSSPEIICITLDNEIALALESNPPNGPAEGSVLAPEYMNNDPFEIQIG